MPERDITGLFEQGQMTVEKYGYIFAGWDDLLTESIGKKEITEELIVLKERIKLLEAKLTEIFIEEILKIKPMIEKILS